MDAIGKSNIRNTIKQKTGKPYQCIVIKLTDTYEKIVFLDSAEIELIKMNY